jgi:hypothetical protein
MSLQGLSNLILPSDQRTAGAKSFAKAEKVGGASRESLR